MDLERFVTAQAETFDQALAELRSGRKRSHWMWFVFPQVAGLGHSPAARLYALAGLEEAAAFAAHPVLGPRLRSCCEALLAVEHSDPAEVLGDVDALKLRSSMTLFARATDDPVFTEVLDRFYAGVPDGATLELLPLS
jgi:uncharacterized protein (DUF1810 family)